MSDPYYKNVVFAMHMNGDNNSPVFTDERMHTVTANGNAKISTARSKFSGSSAYFDGDGDYLSIDPSIDFDLGTGDFTVTGWLYPLSVTGNHAILGTSTGDANINLCWRLILLGANIFTNTYSTSNNPIYNQAHQNAVSLNAWNYFAYVRNGTEFALYSAGVKSTITATSSAAVQNASTTLTIGRSVGSTVSDYYGNLQDIRLYKGRALYTEDFTPPTDTFETDAFSHKASIIQPRHNPDYNGPGTMTGYTRVQTGPTSYTAIGNCIVTLFDRKSKRIVAETISNAAGLYTFTDLNPSRSYYANAFDPTGTYDVTATSNQEITVT